VNDRRKHWRTIFGVAVLFSVLVNGLVSLLEDLAFLHFLGNSLVLALILVPIVSGLRAGEVLLVKHWLRPMTAAILFGLLLVAPFALMEWWNNPRIQSGEFRFPISLFVSLWMMPTVFFLVATPLVRGLRSGEAILAHPVAWLLRVVILAFLATGWVILLRDQMPCFLGGVPGCD
jgi:hypothetical protein